MAHMRRRSSHIAPSPAPAFADDSRPSPLLGRTPRLGGGGGGARAGAGVAASPSLGFGGAGNLRSVPKDPHAAPTAQEVTARVLSVALRILRTPRALAALGWIALVWWASSYVRAHSHDLSQRPVHPRLLPLIRHSGNAIQYLSPDLGSKVKSWHDYQVNNDPSRPLSPEELEAASRHTYHPNGLLLVNPKGRHPIHLLIEDAERKWKEKVARQSRTLSEAVREYKRRHRRNPPKGFDDWCDACFSRSVCWALEADVERPAQVGVLRGAQRPVARRVRPDQPRPRASLGSVRLLDQLTLTRNSRTCS